MTAQPTEDGHDVIRFGGEDAMVVVPLVEYRANKILADRATEQEREDAWMDAAIAEAEEWKAAGCPGGTIPHEIVTAEFEAMGLGREG